MVEAAGGTVEGLVAYLKRREPEHRRFMEEARAEKPRRRRARR